MGELIQNQPCLTTNLEYPTTNDNRYVHDVGLKRSVIYLKKKHRFGKTMIQVYDVFGDEDYKWRPEEAIILPDTECFARQHYAGMSLTPNCDPIKIHGGIVMAHIPDETNVQIPHICTFISKHDFDTWSNGAMISLISNDIIKIPLWDREVSRDEFIAVTELLYNQCLCYDETESYTEYDRILECWNDRLNTKVSYTKRDVPAYSYDTLGTIVLPCAPV